MYSKREGRRCDGLSTVPDVSYKILLCEGRLVNAQLGSSVKVMQEESNIIFGDDSVLDDARSHYS